MMGQLPPDQNALFYDFCLEKHVPADHLLRRIDAFLDLDNLRRHLADFYSLIGRPSIDPELMIRMLLVGYCYGIRSERRLCEEVHLNLAYRWFCRLGLEGSVPDHSTFSNNRHGRFRDSDAFRYLFEDVVERAIAIGLVRGEGFAVDASLIRADANHARCIPGSALKTLDRETVSEVVQRYLDTLDVEGQVKLPKNVSLTDPHARWASSHLGSADFYYATNYLVDTDYGMILDVEATPANRAEEVASTRVMIERVEARFDITPQRLIGDTAYGTAPILGWLVEEKHIAPHVPVWDKSRRKDDTFSVSDFHWDAEADAYRCPQGKALKRNRRKSRTPRNGVTKADTVIYRASCSDCRACTIKPRCCPNTSNRKIARSIYEDARDVARRVAQTSEYRQSACERKKVEMLFAHLKRILKLDRLRLRGLSGARDEFLLAATAQNLRRMAKLMAQPPPNQRVPTPA